ncbi:MAG: VOC family protein [Oscillospiraceae bacterium]|nr:VOC family protein [Oscillospiraceae bacterium]
MEFYFAHSNLNVRDMQRSLDFYEKALGLSLQKEKLAEDGSFRLAFLSDCKGLYQLELTWLREHQDHPYDLGENESHLAFYAEDFEKAHRLHEELGCICFENEKMGIYFIEDPDGYWLEILPPVKARL